MNNIKLNILDGDGIDLAQCRLLSTISTMYTSVETFDSMSDDELRHYARMSLPENEDMLKTKFREIITEPHALGMIDTIVKTIGNQHKFSLDLMMHRHTMKKLEEVNKEIQEIADELGIQLSH